MDVRQITSPLIRTQSFISLDTSGFPYSQLVKLTVEWSAHSKRPCDFPSFSPIQISSVDAEAHKKHPIYIALMHDYLTIQS